MNVDLIDSNPTENLTFFVFDVYLNNNVEAAFQ
jgi:hypothetical protein